MPGSNIKRVSSKAFQMQTKSNLHESSHHKAKKIHEYKQGQKRPKWKAPRGSTSNAWAAKEEKRQEEPLTKKPEKPNNAINDKACHATKNGHHGWNKWHHNEPQSCHQGKKWAQPDN
jgi:hypothetical protein